MYTLTAYSCAGCQQTVYKRKKGKKAQPPKQKLSFSRETPFPNPSPSTLIEQGMASNVPLALSQRQRPPLVSLRRGYHVSGTSKSLAELSEVLPAGERSFFIFLNFLVFFLPSVGGSAQESVCSNSRSEVSLPSEPASA